LPDSCADVAEAAELAQGRRDGFAAWTVEARATDQILLSDFQGRTRSWLMMELLADGGTRLLFGSAIVPTQAADGERRIGWGFRALGRFHHFYSLALLASARRRLASR